MEDTLEVAVYEISRKEYFQVWQNFSKLRRPVGLYKYILNKFKLGQLSGTGEKRLKNKIKLLSMDINKKWIATGKRPDRFVSKFGEWLKCNEALFTHDDLKSSSSEELSTPSTSVGRPTKDFASSSEQSKRQKVRDLVDSRTSAELSFAAQMSVRASGQRDAANLIKEISASSEQVGNFKKDRQQMKRQRALTIEEALALYVDCKLTSHAYKVLRKNAMRVGHYIYPSFYSLKKAKQACYPKEEAIVIDETSAQIQLQAILNHTMERLLQTQENVIKERVPSGSKLTLICKWGGDGSSGHSTYKQKFREEHATDEFLFILSFVPIQLRLNDDPNIIIWQNLRASSTNNCRPIKFLFAKETDNLTKSEVDTIQRQIDNLVDFNINILGVDISVKYRLLLTMIDGKICNVMSGNKSTMSCYICGAKPSEMNSTVMHRVPRQEFYSFGLSTLHAWIKTFECFLHIGYRITLKCWQVKGDANKTILANRKKEIQVRFKSELGLIVDKPKPGFGNTNDGNTARRFFQEHETSAEITGVDSGLIERFFIILSTIASGFNIDLEKFENYVRETKEMYLNLYPWYIMPPTVHKILHHSVDVIRSCIVPIGQLSEEAQEARNKDCRRFRQLHTRKTDRSSTNRDLLTMLLITSDPLINNYREVPKKRSGSLPSEVLKLIIPFSKEKQRESVESQCSADSSDQESDSS